MWYQKKKMIINLTRLSRNRKAKLQRHSLQSKCRIRIPDRKIKIMMTMNMLTTHLIMSQARSNRKLKTIEIKNRTFYKKTYQDKVQSRASWQLALMISELIVIILLLVQIKKLLKLSQWLGLKTRLICRGILELGKALTSKWTETGRWCIWETILLTEVWSMAKNLQFIENRNCQNHPSICINKAWEANLLLLIQYQRFRDTDRIISTHMSVSLEMVLSLWVLLESTGQKKNLSCVDIRPIMAWIHNKATL